MAEPRLSGRQAAARRNDAVILAAARAVFVANPGAPIAAVAERAGVNISSLYRRFASKEDLLRQLCRDGLQAYVDIARAALDDEAGDPWTAFATFMRRIVEADSHALTVKLAGSFQPTDDLWRAGVDAEQLHTQLVARTQAAGALRADLDPEDLSHIFEQLTSVKAATPERTTQLRARYLALHLDALRAPGRTPLPGPPPTAGNSAPGGSRPRDGTMDRMAWDRCHECGFDGERWTDEGAVDAIGGLPARCEAAVADLDDAEVLRRPIPGMWSIGEYVDHVREVLFAMRFLLDSAVAEPGVDLGEAPEPYFAPAPRAIDVRRALAGIDREATALSSHFAVLPVASWTASATIGGDVVDARWICRHAVHDATHHLQDIDRLRRALEAAEVPEDPPRAPNRRGPR